MAIPPPHADALNPLSWMVPDTVTTLGPLEGFGSSKEVETSPAALTLPRYVGPGPLNSVSWITTRPPTMVISIDLIALQLSAQNPAVTVAVPTYLPSNAVVVGACAAAGSAAALAVIAKSILAQPNMLTRLPTRRRS